MLVRVRLFFLLAIVCLSFYAACRLGDPLQPRNPAARPWSNEKEKVSFMFQISSMLEKQPTDFNECLQRVQDEIHQNGKNSYLPLLLVQSSESDSVAEDVCRKPLESCGNCHLPRKNNCDYRVEYNAANGEAQATGRLKTADATSITIARRASHGEDIGPSSTVSDGRFTTRIPRADIVRTVWLNGADAPETWWDFKSFSPRGAIAKKMLAISTENNVACTNCHVQHGDFRLTSEGETFGKTGKLIRRVRLR
ncbi:MAG: hypothetical protein JNM27_12780 [Leptospirales bacterium]|nr:hypothetical protein [Leptospirales bacterium]